MDLCCQNNVSARLVTAFLPRSKCLLISWLQSLSAVIWEPPKIKSLTVSIRESSIQALCLSKLCSHHSTKLHPSILQSCRWDPSRLRAAGTALPLYPSSLESHLIPSMLLDWGWKTNPVALVWPHALLFSFLGVYNSMPHRV